MGGLMLSSDVIVGAYTRFGCFPCLSRCIAAVVLVISDFPRFLLQSLHGSIVVGGGPSASRVRVAAWLSCLLLMSGLRRQGEVMSLDVI
jgi:hypothetical protein